MLAHPSTVITQAAILLFQMAGRRRTSSSGANAKVEPPHPRKTAHPACLIACLVQEGNRAELLAVAAIPAKEFLGKVGEIMSRANFAKLGQIRHALPQV